MSITDVPPRKTIRLAIAEDHTILREGVSHLLQAYDPHIQIVLQASDGVELLEGVDLARPDLVLMDVNMPRMHGIEATRQIKRRLPECRVLILTGYEDDLLFRMASEAGADGYILKGAGKRDLSDAIHAVVTNGGYVCSRFSRASRESPAEGAASLSKREREVLCLVADGLTSKDIAARLFISAKTVEKHRSNIMHKLKVGSLAQLVSWAKEMAFLLAETA
ncbi:MAG: response regulator [Desulfovibrionaceae bacterium]